MSYDRFRDGARNSRAITQSYRVRYSLAQNKLWCYCCWCCISYACLIRNIARTDYNEQTWKDGQIEMMHLNFLFYLFELDVTFIWLIYISVSWNSYVLIYFSAKKWLTSSNFGIFGWNHFAFRLHSDLTLFLSGCTFFPSSVSISSFHFREFFLYLTICPGIKYRICNEIDCTFMVLIDGECSCCDFHSLLVRLKVH